MVEASSNLEHSSLIPSFLGKFYSSRISLRGRSAASLRQNCVTVFSCSENHFSSPSGRGPIVLLISSWGSTLEHCANSSINFSVTDTNSSRTSEAALWPATYISPLSHSTPCIRQDRISSKSLLRLSICLWKPRDRKSGSAGMPRPISYAVFCFKKKNSMLQCCAQPVWYSPVLV